MNTALRPPIRLPQYHPDDLQYPDATKSEETVWLDLQFFPGIIKLFQGETVEQAYRRWYEGTVRHDEYMRTDCPMCARGMVESVEYRPTPYELVEKAISDTTPLPDDIIRYIVYSWVKPREIFDQLIMDLEDYWEEREAQEEEDYDREFSDE